MAKVIYTPQGEPAQEFIFKPGRILSVEAELIEDVGGNAWDTYDQFVMRFSQGHFKAMRAALWILMKRDNPRLRFTDLAVYTDELDAGYDDEELADIRKRIMADDALDDDAKRQQLAAFDLTMDDAPEAPEPGKDEPAASGTDSP
jgi:hypothetical protein